MTLNLRTGFFLLVLLLGAGPACASALPESRYTIQVVPANPDAGFNFPYILRIPTALIEDDHNYLIVESNNSGVDDDFQAHIRRTRKAASGYGIGPNLAQQLNTVLLIPVFPRSRTEHLVYTHALDRDTMLLSDKARRRLDLQLLNMVEDARTRLLKEEVELKPKFVLAGFSASGTFSNRFAFLHPEHLLAVVSGGVNAFPMLPVESVGAKDFNFPLGIADIETLTGEEFKSEAWKALPQMIFMGSLDDNDAIMFDDAYSTQERELIFQHLGANMLERWHASQMIYLQQQPNVSFTTYGQIGHGTDGRVNSDIVSFVRTVMRRAKVRN